jgi:hypothetical protein
MNHKLGCYASSCAGTRYLDGVLVLRQVLCCQQSCTADSVHNFSTHSALTADLLDLKLRVLRSHFTCRNIP